MYRLLILLVFLRGLSACNNSYESPCAISRESLLTKEEGKVFKVDSTGLYKDLQDVGLDSITGGYYVFYRNGMLKEYSFFRDTNLVNYKEQFDSIGIIKYQYAEPLVYKDAQRIGDSLLLTHYLVGISKSYHSIAFFRSPQDSMLLTAFDDTLFTNMKTVRFKVDYRDSSSKVAGVLRVRYRNNCTGEERSFSDTVKLHFD